VQWHPEFHDRAALSRFVPAAQPGWQPPTGMPEWPPLLDDDPILADYLAACGRARTA
jgi:hypothetical protein